MLGGWRKGSGVVGVVRGSLGSNTEWREKEIINTANEEMINIQMKKR